MAHLRLLSLVLQVMSTLRMSRGLLSQLPWPRLTAHGQVIARIGPLVTPYLRKLGL